MTYIDRYLLRAVLVPSLSAFAIAAFFGAIMNTRVSTYRVLAHVLTPLDVLRLGLYVSPTILSSIVPIVLLFGLLNGLGKLADQGELTAMRAAGVPPRRILVMALLLAFASAGFCVAVQHWVQPVFIGRMAELITRDLSRRATIDTFQAGVVHEVGDWRVYFKNSDSRQRILFGVDIVSFESEGAARLFHADSARVETDAQNQTLVLGSGFMVTPDRYRIATDGTRLSIPFEDVTPHIIRGRHAFSLTELLAHERELTRVYAESQSVRDSIELQKYRREIAKRVTVPFYSVGLACVLVPLLLWQTAGRRGVRQRLDAMGALALVSFNLRRLALEPRSLIPLESVIAMFWVPNVTFIVIGSIMFWRAARVH